MKTLDEVIEAIEVCRDSYVAGKIIKSDALHYLKEYRGALGRLEGLRHNLVDELMKVMRWNERDKGDAAGQR